MNTSQDPSWEHLMRAANRGDQRAYGRLLIAITPVVRGIVRARGGTLGTQSGEDIVQEVLLTIHLKRQTWHEDAPLRPWLYAVTRHKVIDAFRARGKRIEIPVDEIAEVLPAPAGPDPFEAQDMERVIDQLDPRAAQIVRAIGIDGDSAAETGARLGMTEGAVRVALHRALKSVARLRERMIE
ncbi:sigma-70 family RNA polymerase sigma factor [Pararhodobacter zhoushanensis]|uniref:sigma-70 family RNA polymerase sigma factor n=1 Tax=Pararhodobacter zhoushanensis TaxID=2479545 RepID=UPI001FEC911C|nr:sigma-70 family RNA polymerase sigma factor [Pararhodobacter zhoushanensis]